MPRKVTIEHYEGGDFLPEAVFDFDSFMATRHRTGSKRRPIDSLINVVLSGAEPTELDEQQTQKSPVSSRQRAKYKEMMDKRFVGEHSKARRM